MAKSQKKTEEQKKVASKKGVKKVSSPKPKIAASNMSYEKKATPVSKSAPEKKSAAVKIIETAQTTVITPPKKPMEKKMSQKTTPSFDKMTKETADMSREYSEACVKSGTILMKGVEDIMSTVVSMAQATAEKQAKFVKDAMSSKTINEFADVQSKIAKESFDDFMESATKITELGVKVLTDSAEPVNAQLTNAVKKATQAVAA